MKVVSFLLMTSALGLTAEAQQIHTRQLSLMGCDFEISVVAESAEQGNRAIQLAVTEIRRIESLISSWDENSQTSQINRKAGQEPVEVDPGLFDLISRSIKISKLTDGAFDISFAGMRRLWRFDGSSQTMPLEDDVRQSVARVGYQNIQLDADNSAVFLKKEGMQIGFGANGKGYAADRARALLMEEGITGGIINASGHLACWGSKPNGDPWSVAITNPINPATSFGMLSVHQGAIVTSGNYEKYAMIDSVRYAHIINPKTGYPTRGLVSVTVLAPSAELADALATSVFVLGIEVGLDRINQLTDIECLIVDESGVLHKSKNVEVETIQEF